MPVAAGVVAVVAARSACGTTPFWAVALVDGVVAAPGCRSARRARRRAASSACRWACAVPEGFAAAPGVAVEAWTKTGAEAQLRGLADGVELLGRGRAGDRDDDVLATLGGDLRLGHAVGVDALADDVDRLVDLALADLLVVLEDGLEHHLGAALEVEAEAGGHRPAAPLRRGRRRGRRGRG